MISTFGTCHTEDPSLALDQSAMRHACVVFVDVPRLVLITPDLAL
jgi:hypothetical protein